MKKLHGQRRCWKPHGRTSLCWSFYCIDNNAKVDLKIYNDALYYLLSNFCMWNKSNNSNEERIDFFLQDLWNNIFLKTCGCKSHAYCKKVRKKSE